MPFFSSSKRRKHSGPPSGVPGAPASYPIYANYPTSPPPYAIHSSHQTLYQPPRQPWTTQQHHYIASAAYPPANCSQHTLQPHHEAGRSQTQPPLESFDLRAKIGEKLDDVISLIDLGEFHGGERDLAITLPDTSTTSYGLSREVDRDVKRPSPGDEKRRPNKKAHGKQVNVFNKLDYYMNSRLPASLPPLRVYMPTYPLLCLAAQYSANAYYNPQSPSERKDFVSADGRVGTKAMVIKSVPCDDKKTIIFAIRGTSMLSVRDWGVNLQTGPVSAKGFLDDEGNLCHSGFLKVAKAMVRPIASRLRTMLEENPNRTSCSLLITGHSAGGAVASLLYAHMLSESVQSELNILTGCFKRVHCITFGAPPVTLLPLQKPDSADGRLRKCLFHSFINEGDPVIRAERAYIKSLVDLLSQPNPSVGTPALKPSSSTLNLLSASMSRLDLSLKACKKPSPSRPAPLTHQVAPRTLWWDVPPATLSNAGRIVVLRLPTGGTTADVTASIVTDEQLRQVIFGDPLVHAMNVYAARIEALAVRAVTGRGGGC